MKKVNIVKSIVTPLDRANVDTDQIIPKQFLKSIKKTGFGINLFDNWRYLDAPDTPHDQRQINPDFVLNLPQYQGSQIILARENFGCGSSREHAPWALKEHGFTVIIASSFADIFFNNCFKNAILPIALPVEQIDQMFANTHAGEYTLEVSLQEQTITSSKNETFSFEVNASNKNRLLEGLDDIGIALQHQNKIRSFEENHKNLYPWLFN